MSNTSLKLSDELELRAAQAAQLLGISPQAFIIDAIREATEIVEQRAEFIEQAQAAHAEMLESGLGHDADQVRAYLRQRLSDHQAERPAPRPWRK